MLCSKRSSSQSGFVHLVLILLLLGGLAVGLYLVQNKQIFKSRASIETVVVKDASGNTLPEEGGLPVTDSQDIKLELTPPTP